MSGLSIGNDDVSEKWKNNWKGAESPEFSGKAIVRLASDEKIMEKSGKILLNAHLALEYGFLDIDGSMPDDFTSLKYVLAATGHVWLSSLVPSFIRIPLWLVHMGSNKF